MANQEKVIYGLSNGAIVNDQTLNDTKPIFQGHAII